jgi:cytochrome c556
MMKHLGKVIAIMIFIAVAATTGDANFNRAMDAIRYRQAVMTLIGHHFGGMGQIVKEKQPYDNASFAEEAAVLEMLSKMPWDAFLFPESDRGKTKLKSNALKNKDEFMQSAKMFEDETAKLAADAKTADFKTIKGQFGATAKSCKDCHDKFKSK